jgi:hypothetical protein
VDPIASHYPELTPFQFASNNPIAGVDQDGLEFLQTFKSYQTSYFLSRWNYDYQQSNKPSAPANPPKPKIALVYSEGSVSMQQLKARAAVMRPVSPEEQKRKDLAAVRNKVFQKQATVSQAKPPGPANEFEAGAVQGVHMAALAFATEACPTCFVAYGSTQVFNGLNTNNSSEVFAGAVNITGGTIGALFRFPNQKITALGASQGQWGVLKKSGKLKDYNILNANVDPAIFKTSIGRDWFWENINKPFLDKVIEKGGKFKFIDDPNSTMIYHQNNPQKGFNFFGREINYIESKNYTIKNGYGVPNKSE